MTDGQAPDPATEPAGGQSEDQRIASLEAGQASLESKVDKILGIVSGGGHEEQGSEDPPGGTDIAHEIRAQLDERDRKAREEAEKASLKDEVAAVKTSLAELSEQAPAPVPRKIERIMGWR